MDTFNFTLEEESKENIKIYLILTVIITVIILGFLKVTYKRHDKSYKRLYKSIILDTIKYIFIEGFLILFESMEHQKINILSSISRISAVHFGLLLYYIIKKPISYNL